MSKIAPEATPLYPQLQQEYAAREKFAEIFGAEVRLTPLDEAGEPSGETFSVRGGSLTVYGDPIVARLA